MLATYPDPITDHHPPEPAGALPGTPKLTITDHHLPRPPKTDHHWPSPSKEAEKKEKTPRTKGGRHCPLGRRHGLVAQNTETTNLAGTTAFPAGPGKRQAVGSSESTRGEPRSRESTKQPTTGHQRTDTSRRAHARREGERTKKRKKRRQRPREADTAHRRVLSKWPIVR